MKNSIHLRLLCTTALLAALFLSAASAYAAPGTAPTVNLIMWTFSDGLNPTEAAVVAAFESSHPDIAITTYHPLDLMTELGSTPLTSRPDIIFYQNDAMAPLLLEHYLTRLEDYSITSAYLSANFEPAAVQAALHGGAVYAIPHLQEGIALLYNKDTLDPLYLPANPLDFTDLAAKAAQYADATGDVLICNQGFSGNDTYHVTPIFFGYGIPDYIDTAGRVYVNDPRAVAAAGWIQNMRPFSLGNNDWDTCLNGLLNGTVGMWWTGPWAVTPLNTGGLTSEKIGLAPMGIPFVGIKQNMVTVYAVDRGYTDEAVEFLKYFDNTANSILYATQEGLIPANTAALASSQVQALPLVQSFADALTTGTPMSRSIYSYCQWGPVGDAVAELWSNPLADPQDELDAAQVEVQACVDTLRDTYFPLHLMLPLIQR